ncbi:unnamed protein product [Prorocentrum cordatum]|uniref:Uncharacterized protein n=1 Tax=Prorocentrum cordatum TaxID=2364126 RepID=A0ABN9UW95_9DINO|nr:unnamed protein product [Polarella glacialis]
MVKRCSKLAEAALSARDCSERPRRASAAAAATDARDLKRRKLVAAPCYMCNAQPKHGHWAERDKKGHPIGNKCGDCWSTYSQGGFVEDGTFEEVADKRKDDEAYNKEFNAANAARLGPSAKGWDEECEVDDCDEFKRPSKPGTTIGNEYRGFLCKDAANPCIRYRAQRSFTIRRSKLVEKWGTHLRRNQAKMLKANLLSKLRNVKFDLGHFENLAHGGVPEDLEGEGAAEAGDDADDEAADGSRSSEPAEVESVGAHPEAGPSRGPATSGASAIAALAASRRPERAMSVTPSTALEAGPTPSLLSASPIDVTSKDQWAKKVNRYQEKLNVSAIMEGGPYKTDLRWAKDLLRKIPDRTTPQYKNLKAHVDKVEAAVDLTVDAIQKTADAEALKARIATIGSDFEHPTSIKIALLENTMSRLTADKHVGKQRISQTLEHILPLVLKADCEGGSTEGQHDDAEHDFQPMSPQLALIEGSPEELATLFTQYFGPYVLPALVASCSASERLFGDASQAILEKLDAFGLDIPDATIEAFQGAIGIVNVLQCLLDPSDTIHIQGVANIKTAVKNKTLTGLQVSLVSIIQESAKLKQSWDDITVKGGSLGVQPKINEANSDIQKGCGDDVVADIVSCRCAALQTRIAAMITDQSLTTEGIVSEVEVKLGILTECVGVFPNLAVSIKAAISNAQRALGGASDLSFGTAFVTEMEQLSKTTDFDALDLSKYSQKCQDYMAVSGKFADVPRGVEVLGGLAIPLLGYVAKNVKKVGNDGVRSAADLLEKISAVLGKLACDDAMVAKGVVSKLLALLNSYEEWARLAKDAASRVELDAGLVKSLAFVSALTAWQAASIESVTYFPLEGITPVVTAYVEEAQSLRNAVATSLLAGLANQFGNWDIQKLCGGTDNGSKWHDGLDKDSDWTAIKERATTTILRASFDVKKFNANLATCEAMHRATTEQFEMFSITDNTEVMAELKGYLEDGRATVTEGMVMHYATCDMQASEEKRNLNGGRKALEKLSDGVQGRVFEPLKTYLYNESSLLGIKKQPAKGGVPSV